MRARRWPAALAILGTAVMVGCTDAGPQRGAVRGSVTLDGRPLAEGKIRFFALTGGVSAEGEVRDGRYDIPADRGPTAGRYRVEVTAERKTGRKVPDRDGGPGDLKDETVEVVPARYNRDSTLQIDYDPAAGTPHDFDLKAR